MQEIFKNIKIFTEISEIEIDLISNFLETEKFTAEQFIFLENSIGSSLYLIKSGIVHIVKKYDKNEYVVTEFKEGDFFGDLSFFDGKPRSASAKSITDTELLVLRQGNFKKIQIMNPVLTANLCIEIMKTISGRLREANEKFANHVQWGLDTKSIEVRIKETMLKDADLKVVLNNGGEFVGKIIYFEDEPEGFKGLRIRVKDREYIVPFRSINYISFRDRFGNF